MLWFRKVRRVPQRTGPGAFVASSSLTAARRDAALRLTLR